MLEQRHDVGPERDRPLVPALDEAVLLTVLLGEGRQRDGIVEDEGRLRQLWLDVL